MPTFAGCIQNASWTVASNGYLPCEASAGGSCCPLASMVNNLMPSWGINLWLVVWSCVQGQLIPQRLVRFKHSQTIRMQPRSSIKGGYGLFAHKGGDRT